jgi:lipopolysaccharide transport system permease protein
LADKNWDIVITPKKRLFDLELKELLKSKDLLFLLFRRDVVSVYKQTLLGPLWFFIQPVLTSFAFTIIFSVIGNVKTDGPSAFLFYLAGMVPWTFFSTCLINNSNTFYANQSVFGKVYFPRLLIPIALTLSNVLKFSLQFILFLIVWVYHVYLNDVNPNIFILLLPLNILTIGLMGLGAGLILSSLSIRFRDINFIVGFLMQLAMYASSVIIPVSAAGKYKWIILANPMTGIIESFRYGFLGTGYVSWPVMAYSYGAAIILFFAGVIIFKQAEKTFIDRI